MTAQAFETGDCFNIFLKFWGFWGSFSVKDFSYKKERVAKSISMLKVKLFSCFTCDTFSKKQSRSSHQRCSIGVLKNFTKFTGKLLCQSLFFNKVQASGLQLYWKRDSVKSVSLPILWYFQEHLFHRIHPDDCFWQSI